MGILCHATHGTKLKAASLSSLNPLPPYRQPLFDHLLSPYPAPWSRPGSRNILSVVSADWPVGSCFTPTDTRCFLPLQPLAVTFFFLPRAHEIPPRELYRLNN